MEELRIEEWRWTLARDGRAEPVPSRVRAVILATVTGRARPPGPLAVVVRLARLIRPRQDDGMGERSDAEQGAAWQEALDRDGRVELRTSRGKLALILLGGAALTAASVWLVASGGAGIDSYPPQVVVTAGWFGIVFFGVLGIPVLGWRLLHGGPAVVVTRESVEQTGAFRIPWADVAGVVLVPVSRGTSLVVIRARDEAAQRRALLLRRSRALGGLSNAITKGPDIALPNALGGSRGALARWLSTLVPPA